ncbi:MAG: twin-arginine translocation signal domain-containing protein [Methylococcales bacterium]
MKRNSQSQVILPALPRRRFLQGLAAGGVLLGMSPWLKPAWAREATATGMAKVLSGTGFDLTIAETPVNFTGTPRMATTVNGSIPAPTLRWLWKKDGRPAESHRNDAQSTAGTFIVPLDINTASPPTRMLI